MNWTTEQQQAIDETGTNIIVSAGAGSGKTAVLSARVMRILSSNIHINELLILTFTKAAAAEMKERIRKNIKKSIKTNPKLNHELELIDQSYITTFDSFALSVVKKYHYLLNISNDISISDSSIIAMKKNNILDEIFDEYYQSDNESFKKLIYDFCVKDDSEIKKQILSISDKIDGRPDRDEYLKNYMSTYFNDNHIAECINKYEHLLLEKLSTISDLTYELSFYSESIDVEKLNTSISPLLKCHTIDDIYKVISTIKLPSLKRGAEDEAKQVKEELKDNIDKLKDIVLEYKDTESLKSSISQTKIYTEIIVEIITNFLNRFHTYKEQNNLYDFQDIALLSIKILKEHKEVAEELKQSFKEIMIDEYQDTNDIQETFISLIENNNVYMVGDVKQSIYRFRNANPYIFKNKYDAYSNNQNGIKIDLVQNFRSRSEVLDNINTVFKLIMDDEIGGAAYEQSHQMIYGNKSYISEGKTDYNYNFEILEYNLPDDKTYSKAEIEIFTIAKDIKNKVSSKYQIFDKDEKVLRDISYKDFVILLDRSADFDLYKKIFEYEGIPLTVFKELNLNNSNDIYILKNIIDYIVKINLKEFDKEYRYDFTSIARSYLFEFTDEEIFNCFKNNNFKDNIIYNTFYPLSKEISSNSVQELLYKIIEKTNMYEKMIKVGDINTAIIRLSNIFDIASNLSNLGYDILTFRNYLKELLEKNYEIKYKNNEADTDSVKLMTIHTSKGLEYHICYYGGLYKTFNIRELNEKFLLDKDNGIITPYFNEGINETFLKYLVKENYIKEEISEKIRLFYVALTRAKEKMILLNPVPKKESSYNKDIVPLRIRNNYRSFSDILNSIKPNISNYYKEINLDEIGLTKEYLYPKNLNKLEIDCSDKIEVNEISITEDKIITEEHFHKNLNELIDKEKKNNIDFGLLVHENLEYIDFLNPKYDLIENTFIRKKIEKFLSSPLLNNIKEANIYKEYEFIYHDENNEYHGIIDLMLEYNDHIDIIDYKLNNIKDNNYLNQLNGYRNYIKTITNKEINIYLYSIISETLEQI